MEATGEKYTEARRALLDSQGERWRPLRPMSGMPLPPWPEDSLGWFTDQAYNAILLAEDEARMLSHAWVGPRASAACRQPPWERRDPAARPRSCDPRRDRPHQWIRGRSWSCSPAALTQARRCCAPRSTRRPLGASSARARNTSCSPSARRSYRAGSLGRSGSQTSRRSSTRAFRRSALRSEMYSLRRHAAQLAASGRTPPSPGPIPPIFERFTSQARVAIDAGIEQANRLNDPYVEPVHLLFGILDAKAGVAASVRSRGGWKIQAVDSLSLVGQTCQ